MSKIEHPPMTSSSQDAAQAERVFHADRWHAKAETDEERFHIMKKEAERDDVDFDKRQHEEFESWQKNLKVVIENFKKRATHPENTDIKTLVVILGGGMKCAYSAGQVMALNELGLSADKVDAVVGASGGAVVATAYVGGPEQTRRTADLMAGPMCSTDFINPTLSRFQKGTVFDLEKLGEALNDADGSYAFDESEIRGKKTQLSYIVTLPTKGNETPIVKFLNAQDSLEVPSITEAINASMALHPRLTGSAGKVNGIEYRDGAINPLPIHEIIERFHPTDILILPQMPYEYMSNVKPSIKKRMGAAIAKIFGFDAVAKGLVSRAELRQSLEFIQNHDHVNIGVMWPPDGGLGTISIDQPDFKAGVMASFRDTFRQFDSDIPSEIPFLNQDKKE